MLACYGCGDEAGGNAEMASLAGHIANANSVSEAPPMRRAASRNVPFAGVSREEKASSIQRTMVDAANGGPVPSKL
jgi:hypothetical protein